MIIWLASYPKSGNTWLRAIISSLLYSNDGIFDFTLLKKITKFPHKKYLENYTNDFGNIHEIKKYWILSQNKINSERKIKFFKTHQLNCKIGEHSFTNKQNTLATIYIVRDPRNLVTSISNHYNKTIGDAKKFLCSPMFIGGSKKRGGMKENDLKVLLGTWADHYNFWKKNNENYLLIKYEDLISNSKNEILKIITFLNKVTQWKIDINKIDNVVKSTNFKNLKSMENEGKFEENAYANQSSKIPFFNLGPENKWQNILDNEIILYLENKFHQEMKELNYI